MIDTTAERAAARDNLWFSVRAVGWLTLAATLSACSGSMSSSDASETEATPTTSVPAPPLIAPELPEVSDSDRDRDRIDDAFQAQADDGGSVSLEVILNAPTLPRHLAAFTSVGGRVEHVFRAVSYGWTGTLARNQLSALRDELGSDLRLIAAPKPVSLFLDEATRTGRVRPVWAPNFAGVASGFSGDSNITIGIVDTGVDDTHRDLAGRMVGFTDYTVDKNQSAGDVVGHGTHVASIALGTGAAFGIGPGTLHYTTSGSLSSFGAGAFSPGVIHTPNYLGGSSTLTVSSSATWLGGASTTFYLVTSPDSSGTWSPFFSSVGPSPDSIETNSVSNAPARFSAALTQANAGTITNFAVANTVADYPAVGDGFGALRGVAPNCQWYAAKVFSDSGAGNSADIGKALDDMVALRFANNIKIVNLSLGVSGGGVDSALRAKTNTVVDNGIVVLVAAGNDGPSGTIGDPGRANLAITVGASNDKNELTTYTSKGNATLDASSDYKPDLLAPGGSSYRSMILAADSNTCDAKSRAFSDQVSDDYTALQGTSMASPFAAGAAALMIDALQKSGINWSLNSNQQPLLIKMLMLASASETNATREAPQAGTNSPTLGRAAAPKDLYEGFGLLNPDAAIEAISQGLPSILTGSVSNTALARLEWERRAWGRQVALLNGSTVSLHLSVPSTADFDLYLYAGSPDANGNPVIRSSSTNDAQGADEALSFTSRVDETAYVFVKRISGFGAFSLSATTSELRVAWGGGAAGSAGTGAAGASARGAGGSGAGGSGAGGSGAGGSGAGGSGAGGSAAGGAAGAESAESGGADAATGGASAGGPSESAGAGASAGKSDAVEHSDAGTDAGARAVSDGGSGGASDENASEQAGDASVGPAARPPGKAHLDQPSGCGCAEVGSRPSAPSGLWLLGALVLARSRRRRASRGAVIGGKQGRSGERLGL
ncbi:MAG: S8 family serine peptidase [Pseudomonadota bacterium]